MKNYLFIVVALLALLTSCKKEDESFDPDYSLQKTWAFVGFFNSTGSEVNKSVLEEDLDINILFFWNEGTRNYEIQGHGPHDLYWGEYKFTEKSLDLKSFETTVFPISEPAVQEYNKLFFSSLKAISHYEIVNNDLMLFLEDKSAYMLFKLNTIQYQDEKPYFTANIDGREWKGEYQQSSVVSFDDHNNRCIIDLGGISQENLTDGYRYTIGFNFGFLPLKGIYTFNNNGIVMNVNNAVMGMCIAQHATKRAIDTRSTTGTIQITGLSRSFMQGVFSFEAKGIGDYESDKTIITNGEFLVPINGNPNWFKPYNF